MGLLDRFGRFLDDVLLLPEEMRARLEAAAEALESGSPLEAERIYAAMAQERPNLLRALIGLAHAREQLGDPLGAHAAIWRAFEQAPDELPIALEAARLALAAGQPVQAAQAARAAAGLAAPAGGEELVHAFVLGARAERAQGRADRAARELRKALSLRPEASELRAELVDALAELLRPAELRAAARGIDPSSLASPLALRVGLALGAIGERELARPFLESAAEDEAPEALIPLARDRLEAGRAAEAEELARRAVARGGGEPALVALAEILVDLDRVAEAAEIFITAASASGSLSLWRSAARTVPLEDGQAMGRIAAAFEGLAPSEPLAHAIAAWISIGEGSSGSIAVAAAAADRAREESRGCLALARLALDRGQAGEALEHLDAHGRCASGQPWARIDRGRAAELRRASLRALWRGEGGRLDLAGVLDGVARFAEAQGLEALSSGTRGLRDELDRPLLLAVLGEFNAGKSTLINAFIGAEVAPMGIVPTTATLNILRGGAERRVRVVRRDGSTREGEYAALRELLAKAEDASEGGGVDHVEIILPSEILERVWILDTPGTNALDPEHEALAREAARRADAVLWIFDAGQAGKKTEERIIQLLGEASRVVVPVLNKIDRLEPAEASRVQESLRAGLGGEQALPISARRALRGRLEGDAESVAASGFEALLSYLEERVFQRSRSLKHAACAGRLAVVLEAAEEEVRGRLASIEARRAALGELAPRLAGLTDPLRDAVDALVRRLEVEQDRTFADAAEEVLHFVRPRAHLFASHGAHREDRAFLHEILLRRLDGAMEGEESHLVELLLTILAPALSAESLATDALLAQPELRELIGAKLAIPFGALRGYQRGLLVGGALHRFFDEVLSRAELDPARVASALSRARPDLRAELRPGVVSAVAAIVSRIDALRTARIHGLEQQVSALDHRVLAPMLALQDGIGELRV
ncbi:MAG: dynamin family protein [Myxococcales bacterium]|nr:dynamin family protein [Myxococcales bacterium]